MSKNRRWLCDNTSSMVCSFGGTGKHTGGTKPTFRTGGSSGTRKPQRDSVLTNKGFIPKAFSALKRIILPKAFKRERK